MSQTIQLNIISFTSVTDKMAFAFYGDKQKGSVPIYWNKIMETFPEDREAKHKNYYTDFQLPREGAIIKEIEFNNAISFSLHYFRYIIFNYFKVIENAIVFPNFTDDIEVWFPDTKHKNAIYQLYNKYTIKVQYKQVTKGYELVIAYNGTSKILHKSVEELPDFDSNKYNLINCNGTVYKFKKMPDEVSQDRATQFPVLSNTLKMEFIREEVEAEKKKEKKPKNQYPIYLEQQENFYATYINTKEFKKLLNINKEGFYKVPDKNIFYTSSNANQLQFLEGTHFNPGMGIIQSKPFKSFTEKHVKLFFIYHKADGKLINDTLFDYIKNGWHKEVRGEMKHTKNLERYINQTLSIDKEKRIVFNDINTIYEEVEEQLKNFVEQPDTNYVAIYISPISKQDKEHPQHTAYYKIKEQLLLKGISSQVIFKDKLDKEDFYYFLSNIYIALLAKIGGIPWKLASTKEDEIIIGIGAFKPKGAKHRFLGSAFCFSNQGIFEGFDCFREDETTMLAGSIRNAVELFLEKNKDAKRVIIHFYKEISDKKELKPILDMLGKLGKADLPVIVVTVNKTDSKELLGFDMKSPNKMPYSGSYVKVGYNKYLLFNNTRYDDTIKLISRDYHFPIKLSIKSSKAELEEDVTVIRELIDQVYQFSRMYWKSVSQQNLPVTTKYPEMVAQIYPHFTYDNLPDFGKSNLWFL